ncbi:unnamed protein product [Linum trigynum]|uniref:Uncharacterized protein n=1 Tax=Linum trigynum TaxID=586398 RepID=A0AAV2DBM8_9ROSI
MWQPPNLPQLRRASEAIKQVSKIWKCKSAILPGFSPIDQREPLPSQTITNPKDHSRVNSIHLRSGKVTPKVVAREVDEKEDPLPEGEEEETSGEKRGVARKASPTPPPMAEYTPALTFPTRVHNERMEAECGGFMEMLQKLHLNIPFLEAMAHMPRYSRYLKGLLSKKPKFEDLANVTLGEECSAFILKRFPKKQPDPGSFTIPLCIGSHHIENSLADLGESINVMSFKLFRRLDIGELKTTRLSVTLADHFVISPRGIVEDVLVRVGKFCFSTDFVILDISEDSEMPLIIGICFLATAKSLIDVNEGILILRDGEERIILGIDPKPRSEDAKEVEPGHVNESGGEPSKVNPTIIVVPCDDVNQESKESISPKEGRKRAWRERISHANAQ